MSDLLFVGDDAANTPLTGDEREQLIPTYISLRAELNEAEQINISDALRWLGRRRRGDLLDDAFLRTVHRHMFGDVWKWAGRYRKTPRNIGVEAHHIAQEMRVLLDDARYWLEHGTFDPHEIAVRLSHRLVAIHPFANGNGRFSRLVADQLLVERGGKPFSWGRDSIVHPGLTRKAYVAALQAADRGDIEPLKVFARS